MSSNFGYVDKGMMWWAEAVLRAGLVIWDTETTGISATDVPIEIGMVDAATGTYLFNTLIYTDVPIHPKAQEVHNITKGMLRGKPEFRKVHEIVDKILHGRDSATYNSPFDTRMWLQAGEKFPGKVWDVMEAYRLYAGLPRKIKQESAALQLGVEEVGTHRAVNDARVAAAIIRKMAEGVVPATDTVLQLASVEINPSGDNDFVKPAPEKRILTVS